MTNAMMNPATTSNEPTMSSREIADVVESRHDNVKVTIQTLEARGLITFTASQEKSTGGRPGVVYRVGKRDSYVIVAQLSPEFTARLVDRWQELEAQQPAKPQVPQSFAEALRLAADTQEQLEQATIERDSVIDTTTRHRQTLAEYTRQFPRQHNQLSPKFPKPWSKRCV